MTDQQPKDIAAERKQATINVQQVKEFFHGGAKSLQRREWIADLVEREPLFNKSGQEFLSRSERFHRGLAKGKRFAEIRNQYGFDQEESMLFLKLFVDDFVPACLHIDMFLPVLRNQSSPEQWACWGSDAESMRLLGCYAQTELGHGSNLSKLETTATLDRATDEWVINSPTRSSAKFWIGALGKTCTHAAVVAQLVIDGKPYGAHPFLVPIRSLEDHTLLPGIKAMDIGPKVGSGQMDNGWAMFDHVRIPRENMLMGYSKVTKDGVYHKPLNDKLRYGTMTYVRVHIVETASLVLSRALTVAIRYSAVRRQGSPRMFKNSAREPQVLDYQTQQHRLFPLLAQAYAFSVTGHWMGREYHALMAALQNGDDSRLADVHAYSTGLKSYCTKVVADGSEDARKSMGGHGYSIFNGITEPLGTYQATNTFEGENVLLTQQAASYLLKVYRSITAGGHVQPSQEYTVGYLYRLLSSPGALASDRCQAATDAQFLAAPVQLAAFEHRAARILGQVGAAHVRGAKWEDQLIDFAQLARAHVQQLIVRNFIGELEGPGASRLSPATKQALADLSSLHSLHLILYTDLGDFVEDGYFSPAQLSAMRSAYLSLLPRIRKNAVALVDAFGWRDWYLNSALGAHDGRAYEHLVAAIQKEPLNTADVDSSGVIRGYHEFIRPLIRGECGTFNLKMQEARHAQAKI
ncbi:acyl-CoA oxidase [Martensiomyces pterosporus]|nr:acyl-CoA oxidase [Martensiomyces pterosporus]